MMDIFFCAGMLFSFFVAHLGCELVGYVLELNLLDLLCEIRKTLLIKSLAIIHLNRGRFRQHPSTPGNYL